MSDLKNLSPEAITEYYRQEFITNACCYVSTTAEGFQPFARIGDMVRTVPVDIQGKLINPDYYLKTDQPIWPEPMSREDAQRAVERYRCRFWRKPFMQRVK